jgi:HPt (histidine-containing phosphotransfer) domain-containing protein
VRQALERLYGDVALYRRLLLSFVERHASTADRVLELLALGDNEPLYQVAHGLKGEAGNLGIDAVHNAADALVKAIRSGAVEHLSTLGDAFAAQLREAVELTRRLAAVPRDCDSASGVVPERELKLDRLIPLLRQLMPLLEAKSFRAREVVRETAALLEGTSLADEFREVDRCATGLRYDVALSELNKLLERLPQS